MRIFYLAVLFSFGMFQSWDNHSELDWKFFETEHFIFYFHPETERSALEASKVAEIIYEPITTLYNYYPDSKTAIIIKDTDDYSNGAAYFFNNKIEVWARPMDFDLRGAHRWIQDVVTHEFVHIVQLGASLKFTRSIPGIYLQTIEYEDERRRDVLYGYPNQLISIPLPGATVPPWFAEGTAQYMYDKAGYDFFDSHREMILRDAVINNNLLSYDEMSSFGKKGIGNENVYNQGFAFVRYIVSKYGNQILKDISHTLSSASIYSFDKAFKKVSGDNIKEVFSDFNRHLIEKYAIYKNIDNLNMFFIDTDGTSNINPVWSENGENLLYLSDKGNDFFNKTDLYLYDVKNKESEKIVTGVRGQPSWISDSTIVYSKISLPNNNGSKFFDIYKYNLNSEKEDRLTFGKRFYSTAYNHKLNKIVSIDQYDGTSNIVIADYSESMDFKRITNYNDGFQIFSVDWIEEKLLFDAATLHGRDVYSISFDGKNQKELLVDFIDERDPNYNQNVDILVWADDRDGIFNLYCMDSNSHSMDNLVASHYVTKLRGGAFYPALSSNGALAFSVFDNGGYRLALINNVMSFRKSVDYISQTYLNDVTKSMSDSASLYNYNHQQWKKFIGDNYINTSNIVQSDKDTKSERKDIEYKDYNPNDLQMMIMPRIFFDYGYIKPGAYFFANDVLDKLSIFSGFGANKKNDIDFFIIFENKNYSHTPYVNLFWISRNESQSEFYPLSSGQIDDNYTIDNKFLFNLFSLDIGTKFYINSKLKTIPGKHKIWVNYQFNNYRTTLNQTQYQTNEFNNEFDYLNGDFSYDYYRAHIFWIQYKYAKKKNKYIKNMLPSNGYDLDLKISYELNDFANGFGVYEDSGTWGAFLDPNNTARLDFVFNKYWLLDEQNISLCSNTLIGYLSNENIDDFFFFHGGGMPGLKGYTYYDESLIGSRKLIQSFYIRSPLFINKNIPLLSSILRHSTMGIVLQAGNLFNGSINNVAMEDFKTSVGLEVRLFGYNFYSYPLAVNYEYHNSNNSSFSDGKHYFKLLFDF